MEMWLFVSIIILVLANYLLPLSSSTSSQKYQTLISVCLSPLLPCCQAPLYLKLKSTNLEDVKCELAQYALHLICGTNLSHSVQLRNLTGACCSKSSKYHLLLTCFLNFSVPFPFHLKTWQLFFELISVVIFC